MFDALYSLTFSECAFLDVLPTPLRDQKILFVISWCLARFLQISSAKFLSTI